MKHLLLACAIVAATAPAQPAAVDAGVAPTCAVDVDLTGLRDGGLAWVLLFSDAQAAAYPKRRKEALRRIDVVPHQGVATVAFEGLECRAYALAVVHDENGNGKLDTNFLGIPREGLGASRNARRMFGPPTFDDAKVLLRAARTVLPITVVY